MQLPRKTYVAEEKGQILGTYYIKTNRAGPGRHVCNCGYMVSSKARGKGLATSMCEHSQEIAIKLGYKAMQFNLVATSNDGAVRLWNKLGFDTVGRLPKAFSHPSKGYVDALVMYMAQTYIKYTADNLWCGSPSIKVARRLLRRFCRQKRRHSLLQYYPALWRGEPVGCYAS